MRILIIIAILVIALILWDKERVKKAVDAGANLVKDGIDKTASAGQAIIGEAKTDATQAVKKEVEKPILIPIPLANEKGEAKIIIMLPSTAPILTEPIRIDKSPIPKQTI